MTWGYWDPRLPEGCTDEDVAGGEEPIAECEECRGPIYEGEEVRDVGNGYVHDDCLSEWARKHFDVVTAE